MLESGARAASLENAAHDRDAVIVAVPFHRVPDLAELFATVTGETVVVDTANYYPHLNGHIEAVDRGQVESLWVAAQLARPVVKAWNAVLAGTLRSKGALARTPGRIAIPVAGDSDAAKRVATRLVDDAGFDPVDTGALADSWRQQPGTPAYCTELGIKDLKTALAAADRTAAPHTRDHLMEHFIKLPTAPTLDAVVETNRSAHR